MLEIQNMIKNYGIRGKNRDLSRLLNQGFIHDDTELVLLKIPTSTLDAGKISIRDNGPVNSNCIVMDLLGNSAVSSKLYKQRKMELEYVYPGDIPIFNVSEVGSAPIKTLSEGEGLISEENALKIWKQMTSGQPEQNAFNALG